uniref:Uncharacterized protein n=1 Tax=Ditylenchus dipsaci TaxID=166011 RepID=A0A915EBA4_9BILA
MPNADFKRNTAHELESNPPNHHRLEKYLMTNYNNRLIPRRDPMADAVQVYFSIGLYQIIEVNEPQEWLLLNCWIVERWKMTFVLESRRFRQSTQKISLSRDAIPTLHKFSCVLDLRYFPFDIQRTLHRNEGWNILSTDVKRHQVKFKCCATPYTLLDFSLSIQRKPLFYFVNLIIPSLMISLISLVGFSGKSLNSPTVNDVREEKINMGITTLLSMSILIFMVADKMPSTSSFIPLIAGSFVIFVQKKGIMGQRPSLRSMIWAKRASKLVRMEMPLLMKQAYEEKAKQDKLTKQRQLAESSLRQRLAGLRKKTRGLAAMTPQQQVP